MGATPQVGVRDAGDAERTAGRYARKLLADLGRRFSSLPAVPAPAFEPLHPAEAWARSGLMALTGHAGGAPTMCPIPLASCADAALAVLGQLAGKKFPQRGSSLLAVRAAIAGHSRRGRSSPGGSCRLLEATDGRVALNLARDEDWELLPAWLEAPCDADWESVAAAVAERPARHLVERGRTMGMAVADSGWPGPGTDPWFSCLDHPRPRSPKRGRPRVLDLSSLWAGPLCAQLLRECGAEVIKVESTIRPDGARSGPRAFFDLLNAGKACVSLDLHTDEGARQLKALIETADVVIEASRPRALRQLGIDAGEMMRRRPGLAWVSITGYGRGRPQEDWVAFGDDAGVGAGLAEVMHAAAGEALMVGDAIADPLTGLHAAAAAWACWISGGGLVSLSLAGIVRHCINFDLPPVEELRVRQAAWSRIAGKAARPAAPPVREMARATGADNAILLEMPAA